jgi:ABC-type spermidine/putrescine transport system permease subunit II
MLRGAILAAWLLAMAAFQVALVALPAGMILAAHPGATAMVLWTRLLSDGAPLAALVAVLSALGPGTLAALALWRRQSLGLASGLLLAPLLVPVGLLGGSRDLAVLLAGHAGVGLAIGSLCGVIGLGGVDRAVLRAAASCGLSPVRIWVRVLLPLAAPGVLAGMVLANVASVALSVVSVALAAPLPLTAVLLLPTASVTAAIGAALVLCAAVAAALALLRRP